MSKTLLDGVNEILKRAGVIAGDSGTLTTLTDSARQRPIDLAVQVINEGIDALFDAGVEQLPKEATEATIVLVAGTRAYSLATDLVIMRWPLIDKTNSQFIEAYPGGYAAMLTADPEQDDTGLPTLAAIRPTDGNLHMDRAPTSADAGRTYTYQYDADQALSLAVDAMPFSDAVFRAMVPAWSQLWKREQQNSFDADLFARTIGLAARQVTEVPQRTHSNPRC